MADVLNEFQNFLGGGTLTIWIVVGALILAWVAWKSAKFAMRIAAAIAAIVLLVSVAPWATEGESSPRADCIVEQVSEIMSAWENFLTKHITVEEINPTAECRVGVGLESGMAIVRLRTFYDIPFQTIEVTPGRIQRTVDLPTDP